MSENEQVALNTNEKSDSIRASPATPKPVFMRLLMLFGGGVGCLLVGIVVSLVTGDLVMLALSGILGVSFVVKGVLLKRKIAAGQIFNVSGVCVNMTPKMLGRYRRIELVNTDTGDEISFVLPKKTVFKVGHVYSCYFDHQISNRLVSVDNSEGNSKVGYLSAEFDLPTNGFLGYENFGIYQEKAVAVNTATTKEGEAENTAASLSESEQKPENIKEEN